MTPAIVRCVVGALLLFLTATKSEAYYYYVYYVYPVYRTAPYYLTTARQCTTVAGESCQRAYCFYSPTRNSCCLSKFQGKDYKIYEQCTCAPGVCTVRPADTTTTTTTTTTTPTTTTPFVSLCPPRPKFRLLNSKPADQCDFKGIAKITWNGGVLCNAVFSPATVNGVAKYTFITDRYCKDMIDWVINTPGTPELQIGKQTYPATEPLFKSIEGPGKLLFLDVDPMYEAILGDLGACQDATCPYDIKTMAGKVDFQDCTVASWGFTTAAEDETIKPELRQVSVRLNNGACKVPPLAEFNEDDYYCFRAVDNNNIYCGGDSGAPVYCKATTNKEPIFVGVIASHVECDTILDFAVIKYKE